MKKKVGPLQDFVPFKNGGGLKHIIEEMKVGQSRIVEGFRRSNLYTYAKRCHAKIRTTPEGDGIRIWRIN